MSEALERRLQEIRELGDEHAKHEAARRHMDELKKSRLAMLMKKYESDYPTAAAQEREARSDPEYLQFLDDFREITYQALKLGHEWETVRMNFEAWRTRQANERAERKAYGA